MSKDLIELLIVLLVLVLFVVDIIKRGPMGMLRKRIDIIIYFVILFVFLEVLHLQFWIGVVVAGPIALLFQFLTHLAGIAD